MLTRKNKNEIEQEITFTKIWWVVIVHTHLQRLYMHHPTNNKWGFTILQHT